MTAHADIDLRTVWETAIPYAEFVDGVQKFDGLWRGVYRTARIPEWALERAHASGRGVSLLAITEDWCWDAANTLPLLAKLSDQTDTLPIRVICRDEHLEVMDRYLTNGARAIPVVIALDAVFNEIGHWGPRPRELQAWALANRALLSKEDFYAQMKRWMVRDRGSSVLREVLDIVEARPTDVSG